MNRGHSALVFDLCGAAVEMGDEEEEKLEPPGRDLPNAWTTLRGYCFKGVKAMVLNLWVMTPLGSHMAILHIRHLHYYDS